MGLDMYLNKVKKVDGLKMKQILNIESYIEWLDHGQNCTLEEWCGINEDKIVKDSVDNVRKEMHKQKGPAWADEDYVSTYESITDNIVYWRKANQIHKWFVDNVQDGVDDCGIYRVKKKQLKELLKTAKQVLESCVLVDGKVTNGYEIKNGEQIPITEDGKYIKDPSLAEELLPTTNGFFFGSTDYDQWYYKDISYTVSQIKKVLDETDFDNYYVYYSSSW